VKGWYFCLDAFEVHAALAAEAGDSHVIGRDQPRADDPD
jgi:hypothetical protein